MSRTAPTRAAQPLETGPPTQDRFDCRHPQRGEVDQALRLLLANGATLGTDEAVLDFLSFTMHRGVNVNDLWVAVERVPEMSIRRNTHRGAIAWTMLPIVSPGRTAMLMSPNGAPAGHSDLSAIAPLTRAVCSALRNDGVQIAQAILDPRAAHVGNAYADAGFTRLAELVYLDRAIKARGDSQTLAGPTFPSGFTVQTYAPSTHALFARAIRESYEQSLDCPGLNGLREIDDVIAGHRAAGEFDPKHWLVLCNAAGQPVGVLLLNRATTNDAIELAYVGLPPASRSQGLGAGLVRLAIDVAREASARSLCLAVDRRNAPALKLYHRHGFKEIGSRLALIYPLAAALEAR